MHDARRRGHRRRFHFGAHELEQQTTVRVHARQRLANATMLVVRHGVAGEDVDATCRRNTARAGEAVAGTSPLRFDGHLRPLELAEQHARVLRKLRRIDHGRRLLGFIAPRMDQLHPGLTDHRSQPGKDRGHAVELRR
jgi:hypothetical protein